MTRPSDYERELDELQRKLDEGRITIAEYNREAKAIDRWYRDAARADAEDAAREAYDREMERW